ncbi:MAG: TIGR04211 family SH3 domain-containing protein [Gammaproteobacteria bacterium]|nr:TIGR04211 family SH3 domain-containing protein [Gammaproteobacteria bacterium]NND55129.1 TIGR04211 family SH3 domain-containing protein [Gammaproteobacteria bacterium]
MNSRVRLLSVLSICLAGWFSSGVHAETGYVTDMLQLDLYADEAMNSKKRKLRSGDSFEILTRKGRAANVRLPDGQTGWVKTLYVVTKEPARTRLNKLEAENENLQALVETLRAQVKDKQDRIDELEGDESSVVGQLASAREELTELRDANEALESTLSAYGSSVPLSWLLIGTMIALALGIYGGWYFIDSRSRARHGGYRVY